MYQQQVPQHRSTHSAGLGSNNKLQAGRVCLNPILQPRQLLNGMYDK
jgi:hypothetical protein